MNGKTVRLLSTVAIATTLFSGIDRAQALDASLLPPYSKIAHFTLTIAADGDLADVYFPELRPGRSHTDELPIALMLPGALVDESDYSNFASQVARFGFVVVVPNNQRTLVGPGGQGFSGLFAEQEQVNQVLAQMRVQDRKPTSPIFKIFDTTKLGLLGHSFGAA